MLVNLTKKQISTALYVLEGYVAGLDDCIPQEGDKQLVEEIDEIHNKLSGIVAACTCKEQQEDYFDN